MSYLKRGFHLIEILITLVIISILAMLSLPLYSHYLVEERRLEAAGMLSKLAIALEEYHVENNTYQTTLSTLNFPTLIVDEYYQLIMTSETGQDYLLIAKPLGHQADEDTCGSLTLDSTGKKGITGTGNIEACW